MPIRPLPQTPLYVPKSRRPAKQASLFKSTTPVDMKPEEIGLPRRLGAMGVRGLAALLSMEGGGMGAVISGAGEGAAEALEGSEQSLPRIGVEAGIGAIPFSALFRGAKLAEAVARGAIYGGVGEAGREWAKDEDLSPSSIATGAGVGGLTSGIGRYLGLGGTTTKAATPKLDVLHGSAAFDDTLLRKPSPTTSPQFPHNVESGKTGWTEDLTIPVGSKESTPYRSAAKGAIREEAAADKARRAAIKASLAQDEFDTASEGLVRGKPSLRESFSTDIPGGKGSVSYKLGLSEEDQALQDTEDALKKAAAGKAKGGAAKAVPRTVEEIVGATNKPPPTSPLSTVLSKPSKSKVDNFQLKVDKILETLGGPKAAIDTPSPVTNKYEVLAKLIEDKGIPVPEQVAAKRMGPIADIPKPAPGNIDAGPAPPPPASNTTTPPTANWFPPAGMKADLAAKIQNDYETLPPEVFAERLRLGNLYGEAQGAEKRGVGAQLSEIRNFMTGTGPFKNLEGVERDLSGRNIGGTPRKSEQGIPPPVGAAAETAEQAAARVAADQGAASSGPDWIKQEAEKVEQLSKLPKKGGSETGEINQELLLRLGFGGAGAAIGYATDPFDNPTNSALAGSIAGVIAPSVLRALRNIPGAVSKLNTAEGVREVASELGRTLPQVNRFNLLLSRHGLPANVVAGPIGSGILGAIEHGLNGDPRGWKLLGLITNPSRFTQNFLPALDDAARMIGEAERAGGASISSATNEIQRTAAIPGAMMTAGDKIVRDAAIEAGFSIDEARRMTLTSEPWSVLGRKVTNFTRGNPVGQLLAPFTRTTMNIAEQGAERTPGIGSLVNLFKSKALGVAPDSKKLQAIKQTLGAGYGVGAEQLGENLDPEQAKVWRRYITNFAGANSGLAALGFGVGQARRAGKPTGTAAVREIAGALPLPTTQPITDLGTFIASLGSEGGVKIPRTAIPAMLRELMEESAPAGASLDRRARTSRKPQP